MKNGRIWIFRLLVLVCIGLMLVAWFMPWWTIDVEGFATDAVQIRPWGLEMCEQMGGFGILLKGADMPAWFPYFMWTFLALCMAALVYAMVTKGPEFKFSGFKFNLSQIFVAGVGFAYNVMGAFAAFYASMRMKDAFGAPLQGHAFIDKGEPLVAHVDTYLLPGFWMIFVAGIALLIVGLLRNQIVGDSKS